MGEAGLTLPSFLFPADFAALDGFIGSERSYI
uniref:Uncharacterized protein n=2 Tax=unclassified Caudoviricetes TaxID=2788787 RepID=A0A8S5MN30_9CAUD|nr:MAG TPA: hypothetical protein [Siphoviridae sp. ct89Z21]DAE12569.1 MAG TPA: hypothetical protein [Siphoviridae sp. ctGfm48]DAM30991.1 MAG TPA: hypothetical protein [Caudoviricetes sp.]